MNKKVVVLLILAISLMLFGLAGLLLMLQEVLTQPMETDTNHAVPHKPEHNTVIYHESDFRWDPALTVWESSLLKSEKTSGVDILKVGTTGSPVTGRVNHKLFSTEYQDGMKHGYEESYHRAKKIKTKRLYYQGESHGPYVQYYSSGAIREIRNYDRGYIVGERKVFYKNGSVWFSEKYSKPSPEDRASSVRQSQFTVETSRLIYGVTYYQNGQIQSERNYVNGKLDGLVQRYLSDGSLFSKVEWKKGIWLNAVTDFPKNSDDSSSEIVNTLGMQFVHIESGTQEMSSADLSEGDGLYYTEALKSKKLAKPRQIKINGFYLAKYEMTQEQYELMTGIKPSMFAECGSDCPVDRGVSSMFIRDLNRIEACSEKYKFYYNAKSLPGCYRIPTLTEWTYAAKAGSKGRYHWQSNSIPDDYAWYDNNSNNRTQPVGTKKPNAWGLYDMFGNVSERTVIVVNFPTPEVQKDSFDQSMFYPHFLLGGNYKSTLAELSKKSLMIMSSGHLLPTPTGGGHRILMDGN
tara:strand:- start:671 stop:2227 length:1557 start_codon:yes stop_codon:yes gene_type:complete